MNTEATGREAPAPREMAGWTAAEFAARRGVHLQAVRHEYARRLRQEGGIDLPALTRTEREGELVKFCLEAGHGLETESVIIPMETFHRGHWRTLCLSTQVGCRMGCTFCETARMGWLRNLTAAEIVTQRLVARRLLHEQNGVPTGPYLYDGDGIRNLVFMGMGEPLDNFDEVIAAIRVMSDPRGLAFPRSQMTLSTVGRTDGLERLAELVRRDPTWASLRLAISLHAAHDDLRDRLVPINRAMPLAALQDTLRRFPLPRRGLFLVQYVLLAGINDSLDDADAVAEWCRPLRCVVNLIPYNPQRQAEFATPEEERVQAFLRRLRSHGIFVKRRVTHGRDLMGACGQLGNPELRGLGAEHRRNQTVGSIGTASPARAADGTAAGDLQRSG